MSFIKGVNIRTSGSQNTFKEALTHLDERAGSPVDEQLRVSYGRIIEVDEETSQVKVLVFGGENKGNTIIGSSKLNPSGIFVPVLQPSNIIHMLFGLLRKGLIVRIFWRGKNQPGAESIVEVISDEYTNFFETGKKEPEPNVITIGPYKIFSGGMGL